MATQSLRGRNLRIMNGSTLFAEAETNCTITLNTNQQDVSTKDDQGLFSKQDTTTKSWSIQVDALNVLDVAALLNAVQNSMLMAVGWTEYPQENSMSASWSRTGQAYINDITFVWNNREFAAKTIQLTGVGELKTYY